MKYVLPKEIYNLIKKVVDNNPKYILRYLAQEQRERIKTIQI